VLAQRFGEPARREVIDVVVRAALAEAVRIGGLRPVGDAKIDAPAIEPRADLHFSATFEVLPDVTPGGVEGMSLTRPEPAIDDEDVDAALEAIRRQRVTWRAVARAARAGDRATVNSSGLVDGEMVEGLAGVAVPVVLGEGQFLAEVEREIVGLAAGDRRTTDIAVPADFGYADIAGRTVTLTVETLEVAEPVFPDVDPEFVRALGIASGSVDELRAELRQRLEAEFAVLSESDLRRQMFDQLVAANPVPVPQVLVEQQASGLRMEAMRALAIFDPDKARPLDAFRPLAERRLRTQIVMEALATREGIACGAEQLEDRICAWLAGRATVSPLPMTWRALVERARAAADAPVRSS
jgi:trigger factor